MKYKLQDLIDIDHFQNLQDRLNEIYSFPSSIIDNDGNILTATAWQDFCTKFHRKNKETERICIKSDQYIISHIHEANPAVSYRCPHGLVDNATPIIIDGIHYGNFFTGQFLLEEPDLEFFKAQAKKYGFDEYEYLKAVKKIPIWTQEQLNSYLFFIKGLITVISESGLKTLKEIENRKKIQESEKQYRSILMAAIDGYWLTDTEGRFLDVNNAYCRMSGYREDELLTMRIGDLEVVETAEIVAEHMQKVVMKGSDRFESKHRRKDGSVYDVEVSVQFRPEDGGQCVCFLRDISELKRADMSLRTSEKKYRTLFRNMAQGVFYQSADGVLFDYNDTALEMFGLTPDQFIGKTSLDPQWKVIKEDGTELPGDRHPSMIALQTRKPVRDFIVGVYNPRTESYKWLLVNAIPQFHDVGEKPYQVFVTLQDITDRKQAEDNIRKSENNLRATFDATPFPTAVVDLEDDNIFYWSRSALTLFGHTAPTTSEWYQMAYPDPVYRQEVIDRWKPFLEKARESGLPVNTGEYRVACRDGTVRICELFATYLSDHLIVTFNDITERKLAEETLRESEEKFRNFTEQSFVGFYIIQDDVFKYVNPKFADVFGYTVDECMNGMHFRQIVHTEDLARVQEQVRRRVAGEIDAVQYTFRGVKKTGEIIHVAIYGSALIYQGRPAAIGTMLDITKELEMEKRLTQSQRMEAIGSLAGGIAHDFNNLLFPIVGLSEMLMDDLPPDSPEHENAVEIHNAGRRGSDLVKQILAFSRQSEQKKMPIRVQQVLQEVMKLSRTIPVNIKITQDIQSDCPMVLADPTQVHQIAMNLITNAYHAVEPESGEIAVRLREVEIGPGELDDENLLPGRYALLSVSDTGIGIEPAIMHKIFEPYFTTKEQGKGTGLGLAVVYGIVKEHHGDIKVYSELGKGTTFNVYLPTMAKAEKSSLVEREEESQTGHERILLVDDEEPIANLEKQVLERLGYKVTTRINSLEALEVFKARPDAFDMVISDMTMPQMTGDQLARKLIAIRPDIPILICTGFSERLNQEKAASIGVKGFLMKPIAKSELAKTVRKMLDEAKGANQG